MSASPSVRAVVFDVGGVLLEWDPGLVYRELISDPAELRYRLDPAATLFVDDADVNVRGARAAGFRAHHFVDPSTLALELRDCGLLLD